MKKMNFVVIIIATLSISLNLSYGQKLPNIQPNNQSLPKTVIIDGKLNEWGNELKAFNKATRVEYIIANNAKSLYLAIRSKDVGTTAKVLAGGITFTINTARKKLVDAQPSITVPLTNSTYTLTSSGATRQNFPILTDSLTIAAAIKQLKFIKVSNLKGIQDTVLSIYNEHAILTKMVYDSGSLICEMLIPKELFGLTDVSKTFAYQIKLAGVLALQFEGGVPPPPPTPPANRLPSDPSYIAAEIRAPTDFWGEYTWAK